MINTIEKSIINDYKLNFELADICNKYNIKEHQIYYILRKYNVPRRRFNQTYLIKDSYAIIVLYGGIKTKIDIEDIDKCKSVGIWTINSNGYVMNCKNGIYLHRFVMDCPDDLEVDHIYHDLLDNRKNQLRLATSSQQKCNTKLRRDNTSGIRGVYFDNTRKKWAGRVTFQGNLISQRFDTYEEAQEFVLKNREMIHGDFIFKNKEGE